MQEHKNFWDRNAGRYNRFMRKDRAAYDEMYELIRPVVRHKTVLELATGTGLIAKHIVNAAAHIEATDASAEMIAEAKRDNRSAKLHFSVQDMFRLPYVEESFDVAIVSNALHTLSVKAVCRLVWAMNKAENDAYLEKAMSGIPEHFSGKLLEVPVGTGILTMPVYQTMPEADITCLDYSPDMMR